MEPREQPEDIASSARLETFADGVFAIAITLLVLGSGSRSQRENVARAILNQWPSFLAYITSFLTIGPYGRTTIGSSPSFGERRTASCS